MLTKIRNKLMALGLVGAAWLGSHAGCDSGYGGYYQTLGGYFGGYDTYYEPVYYEEPYYVDPYYVDPYYYDGGYGYVDGYW